MNAAPRVGVLGGTLDPIHLGHVETARAARAALKLDRVVLMPASVPPHRHEEPAVSGFHRFAMAALTAAAHEWMLVSDDELRSAGPSFTAETLERLRASGLRRSQIFFITGADAFAEIDTWHRYPAVLDLAHFVVVSRPGLAASALPGRMPALKERFLGPDASTGSLQATAVFLVDAATPDISSSDIRRRRANGESIAGLVCPAVEGHIERHGLYGHGRQSMTREHARTV